MKRKVTTLAVTAIMAVAFSASAIAKGTGVILSESDWNAIEEEAEMESMLAIEEIPALRTINVKELEMDFVAGKQVQLKLDAPFAADEVVGLVVLDKDGEIVQTASGTYNDLKTFNLASYYDWDMTYVVRMYSESAVYETKVQVVYR